MMRYLRIVVLALLLPATAYADVLFPNLGAGAAVSGTDVIACYQGAEPVLGCTAAQLDTYLSATTKTLTNKTISGGTLAGTLAGTPTYSGVPIYSGLSAGTQVSCLGLDSGNHLVLNAAACGSGGSSTGLGVHAGQVAANIGDNATALAAGKYLYELSAALTTARSKNLPDSATQGAGLIAVHDAVAAGGVSASNTLTLCAAGTDTLNGSAAGCLPAIKTPYFWVEIQNDGAGNWWTGPGSTVAASNAPSNNFANGIDNNGLKYAQPAFSNLSGNITAAQSLALTSAHVYVGNGSNVPADVALSGDCTMANTGAITCTKTSGTSFSTLATTTPGTGVATAAAANLSAAGGLTTTIASGTSALGTGAISSAACASVVTTAATNTATTDVVLASFNGDPTGVTGYIPATAGMLTIVAYPTSGNVNFKVCNNTSSSITPGAITLNWRVVR